MEIHGKPDGLLLPEQIGGGFLSHERGHNYMVPTVLSHMNQSEEQYKGAIVNGRASPSEFIYKEDAYGAMPKIIDANAIFAYRHFMDEMCKKYGAEEFSDIIDLYAWHDMPGLPNHADCYIGEDTFCKNDFEDFMIDVLGVAKVGTTIRKNTLGIVTSDLVPYNTYYDIIKEHGLAVANTENKQVFDLSTKKLRHIEPTLLQRTLNRNKKEQLEDFWCKEL